MATPGKPTQDFVPIQDIRSGTLLLKDGSYRILLLTSSVNFGLKSRDEQMAIIQQFQELLNSLEFSIQIFIQSRRFDINPYLVTLEERQKAQVIDLMKVQIREYMQFVRSFTQQVNIMSKTFLIVIPYAPGTSLGKSAKGVSGTIGSLLPKSSAPKQDTQKSDHDAFEESRVQLEQRAMVVEQGLARCGLRVERLGTEEITEFFYRKFNPGELDASINK